MTIEVEVRIRHHTEENGVPLCTWPATALDTLIPTLTAWGVDHTRTGDEAGDSVLTGGFRVDDTTAYFEVVMNGDE